MSDSISVTGGNYITEPTVARGSAAATGALRRKYNFGDMVSELALAQDPFFRFLSKVAKKPTDDPQFKFTEKRSSYTKRYAYMDKFSANASSTPSTDPDGGNHTATVNSSVYSFKFYTDYNSNGNQQNIYGQTMS